MKISILLIKTYVGPFIVTFLVAMFIFEMQFIWVWLDEILGKGLSTWDIVKLLVFASARVVNMALPLAVLMSSIMAMGAMAESNELTAMKSAGISLVRILRPLIVVSIAVSMIAFVFANNIWPVCNLKLKTYLFNLSKQKPSLSLEDGIFYNGIQGISIRAGRNDIKEGILHDILIYDHRGGERENRTVIRAKTGQMQQTEDKTYMILRLADGESYDEQKQNQNGENKKSKKNDHNHVHGSFDEMTLRIDLSSLKFSGANEDQMKNPAEMMTIRQLNVAIDSLHRQRDTLHYQTLALADGAYNSAVRHKKIEHQISHPLFDTLNYETKVNALGRAREHSRKAKDQLIRFKEDLQGKTKMINRHAIEWHRKFFLAVVCMVLFFIGAPLGAIIRKGGIGMPTLIALGLFIVYQLLTMAGERMAKNQIVDPWVGIWLSTFLLFPMSVWIFYKATREARMFDGMALSKIWMQLKRLNQRKQEEVPL
jgi:lipopolysaccharide export system permease protein